jgi:hypothetical protein
MGERLVQSRLAKNSENLVHKRRKKQCRGNSGTLRRISIAAPPTSSFKGPSWQPLTVILK